MIGLDSGLPLLWDYAGVLVGFLMSLMIMSYLLRENLLARGAQYLLVGAGLGYAAILAWSNVLWPRLFVPLIDASDDLRFDSELLISNWLPLLLGLLLWIGGLDLLRSRSGPSRRPSLRILALLPASILAGVGLGSGLAGAIQGTLIPQFLRAAFLGSFSPGALETGPTGLLTLFITGGTMLHLYVGSGRLPAGSPRLLSAIVQVWSWVGLRALWIASGFIFARLAASRLTLLIARMEYFLFGWQESEVWPLLQALLRGGG